MKLLTALVPLSLVAACGGGLTELPDPPPQAEWAPVTLDRTAAEDQAADRFQDARRALNAAYLAWAGGDRAAFWEHLSFETRALLDELGGGDGLSVLTSGVLVDGDTTYEVDPLALFLPTDPMGMTEPDDATAAGPRRVEIDIADSLGQTHRVVLIYEGDAWRLHRPRIALDGLTPVTAP